jgi:REP element-mobilizing transposase RayT
MAQSLSKIFIHLIFHIKNGSPEINQPDENELYAYMGAIIKDNESIPIIINGTSNHIHILCVMSKSIALSKLVEEIKRHSSRWIKTKGSQYRQFAWQGGYGAFSVSPSLHDKTKRYIENQKNHHLRKTHQQEYLLFLKKYGINFNEQYLWTD